jgi:hypothetical protein
MKMMFLARGPLALFASTAVTVEEAAKSIARENSTIVLNGFTFYPPFSAQIIRR